MPSASLPTKPHSERVRSLARPASVLNGAVPGRRGPAAVATALPFAEETRTSISPPSSRHRPPKRPAAWVSALDSWAALHRGRFCMIELQPSLVQSCTSSEKR